MKSNLLSWNDRTMKGLSDKSSDTPSTLPQRGLWFLAEKPALCPNNIPLSPHSKMSQTILKTWSNLCLILKNKKCFIIILLRCCIHFFSCSHY